MAVARPTLEQMTDIVDSLGMSLAPERIAEFIAHMGGSFAAYDLVESLPDFIPEVKYPRTPGRFPSPAENPLNAWYVKSEVKGAPDGKLKGKTVALKDNVCLAGVPMMNGSATLEGYVPNLDATIVTRLLDAGATILGKAHCEYFCFSGGSHTNSSGPVVNPRKPGYSAGGSSSGSAALVAAGEVDMAIGGDQGGSIRIPAAYCGIYGMKATHGLVPYTGVMPIESTIDHTGPMTANVADNALMLEVLAGEDGLDPRQYAPQVAPYTQALGRGVKGMKIGVVREGFGFAQSEEDVDAKVRAAADAAPPARRRGRRDLDPDAPPRRRHLDPGRQRGRPGADDARQRHGLQLEGPLHGLAARRPCGLARARRRAVRHAEDHHDGGPVFHLPVPRPLLRQGAEPRAPAEGRL